MHLKQYPMLGLYKNIQSQVFWEKENYTGGSFPWFFCGDCQLLSRRTVREIPKATLRNRAEAKRRKARDEWNTQEKTNAWVWMGGVIVGWCSGDFWVIVWWFLGDCLVIFGWFLGDFWVMFYADVCHVWPYLYRSFKRGRAGIVISFFWASDANPREDGGTQFCCVAESVCFTMVLSFCVVVWSGVGCL